MKGKDVRKCYLKGKADPGLTPPMGSGVDSHQHPQGWSIPNPPSAGHVGWGQGDIPQNQGGRWLEMHYRRFSIPNPDSNRITVKKPGCSQAAALGELCQESGGKRELEAGGWLVLEKY